MLLRLIDRELALRSRHRLGACAVLAALLAAPGCSDKDTDDGEGGKASSSSSGEGGHDSLTAPAAGIDGCNAAFVEDDSVCRPLPSKCAAGTIPDIDAGCVPVGVPDCDPSFIDDRGLCLPTSGACTGDTFPVPTLGCVSIDGDLGCGTGTWGNVADDAVNVYVDASYANADSDGTKAKPFVTLANALTAAPAGSRLVLAAGSYQGGLIVSDAIEIRGVCASKVTLGATAASYFFSMNAPAGSDIALSDLTIDSAVRGMLITSGNLALTRVRLEHLSEAALDARGNDTHVTIDGSLFKDTTVGGVENTGTGFRVQNGATLDITHSAVIHTSTVGIQAYDATINVDDVFIGDTILDPGQYGYLATSQEGGKLNIKNMAATHNAEGFWAGNAKIDVVDSVIGETTDPLEGEHVFCYEGGDVSMTRCAIADGDTFGVHEAGGKFTGDTLLVEDLGSTSLGGVGISSDKELHLTRTTIARVTGVGLGIYAKGDVSGLSITDVAPDSAKSSSAIVVRDATATIDRTFVSGALQFGVLDAASGSKTGSLAISHTTVENIEGTPQGEWGLGLALGVATVPVSVADTRVAHVHGAGVLVSETTASLSRVFVSDVAESQLARIHSPLAKSLTGPFADGVLFVGNDEAPTLTMEDVWIEGAVRSGVTLSTGDHSLTRVRAKDGPLGLGLRDGAAATVTDSDFSGNTAETEDPTELAVP